MGIVYSYTNGVNSALQRTGLGKLAADTAATVQADYTGAYGTPIPVSQGVRKLTGTPIWRGPVVEIPGPVITTTKTFVGPFGVPTTDVLTQQSTTLVRSFAVAFGYNLAAEGDHDGAKVRRVWVDGTLVYANGGTVQPIYFNTLSGAYNPTMGKVQMPTGLIYGDSTGNYPGAVDDSIVGNLSFQFYEGTEEQLPDATIAADQGANTPAYRGMMYMVIHGLPVGQGGSASVTTGEGGAVTSGGSKVVANRLPDIKVELVDGTQLAATLADFTHLPGAPALTFSDNIVMVDYENRLMCIAALDQQLHTWDIDGKTELECRPITGLTGGDTFGDVRTFETWDKHNDIIYGYTTVSPLASLNRKTGVATLSPFTLNNFNPEDAGGGDPVVTGLPAVKLQQAITGHVIQVLQGGKQYPLIGASRDYFFAISPSVDGVTWPSSLPANAIINLTEDASCVIALPLADLSIQSGRSSYQDAAFLVSHGQVVTLVYVTARLSGTEMVTKIVGQQDIFDSGDPAFKATGFCDNNGQIYVSTWNGVTGAKLTRFAVSYTFSPDFVHAPGWQGIFPKVGAAVYSDVTLPAILASGINHNFLQQSEYSRGTLAVQSAFVNLSDGSASAIEGSTVTTEAWNSRDFVRYSHGNLLSEPTYHGAKWLKLTSAIAGDVGSLGTYLHNIATRAGFSDGNIDVDPLIDDQVVGMLFTQPTDVTNLFNSLAAVYGFIWFNSGGVLKFVKLNQAPLKANGLMTLSSNPTDGKTFTIGAVVYTFRTTPAAPFDIAIQATTAATLAIAVGTVNGAAGIFPGTVAHADVVASLKSDTEMLVTAKVGGTAGNSIVTVGDNPPVGWSHSTLTDGSVPPPPSLNLTVDDMQMVQGGPTGEGAVLITTFPVPALQNQGVSITYYNLDADYAPGTQTYIPDQGADVDPTLASITNYALPVIMANAEAYFRIVKVAMKGIDNEVTQELQLPQKFMRLEPSDIIGVSINQFGYTIRLDEVTYNGDWSISINGTNYTFRDDIPIVHYPPPVVSDTVIHGPGDGTPVSIDGPILDPSYGGNATVFIMNEGVASYGQVGWEQASLGFTLDTSATIPELFQTTVDVRWGTLNAALPDTDTPWLTDDVNTIRIICKSLSEADLAQASYLEFCAGRNMVVVGAPGRWEYIYFKSFTLITPKVIELTGLNRGRRGTEVNTGNHEVGDKVYLVSSLATSFQPPLQQQPIAVAEIGEIGTYIVTGIPATRPVSMATVTFAGNSIKPFSPTNVQAALVTGDIDLSWQRRDRFAVNDWITDPVPLSETAELYDLEILDPTNTTVVRTLAALSSPSYTYLAADQVTDGYATPPAALKVRVYQIGSTGRGFMKEITVNVE